MKKGISIWSFPPQPLEESFRLAKDAGFEGVEVALDDFGGFGGVEAGGGAHAHSHTTS